MYSYISYGYKIPPGDGYKLVKIWRSIDTFYFKRIILFVFLFDTIHDQV